MHTVWIHFKFIKIKNKPIRVVNVSLIIPLIYNIKIIQVCMCSFPVSFIIAGKSRI